MSSFVRESKFRNIFPTVAKREDWYEQLKVADSSGNDNCGVASNSRFLAYADSGGGGSCVGVLPLTSVGKNHVPVTSPAYQQPLIRAHGQAVSDLVFNPHDSQQLFTCSADGTVKIWAVPEAGFLVDESTAVSVITPSFGGSVKGLATHASAASIVAIRGSRDAAVLDLKAGVESLLLPSSLLGGAELQSLGWSFQGDVLLSTSKDKNLRVIDPRSAVVGSCFESHAGMRNLKSTWLGDSPYFLSCGLGAMQQREYALWDSRAVGSGAVPLKRERIDAGRGVMLPIFDVDNSLLLLVGKGDVSMRVYEFDKSKDGIFPISSVNVGDPIKGATLMPKQANDLMACEVLRVLKLAENSVQPVSFTVPRKEKLIFHGDLFPPTISEAGPSLTPKEWLDGETAAPKVVALSAPSAAPRSAVTTTELDVAASEEVSSAAVATAVDDPSPSVRMSTRVGSISFGSTLGSNKFKHMFGTESPRNSSYFNLKPNIGTSDSPLLACSDKFWAIPWQGTGGPIYVSKHGSFGKVEPSVAIVDGHRGPIQDLAFSPFHSDVLVSASDDCKVKVWKIPEEGIVGQNFVAGDEAASLDSHTHSVRTCNFHPTVAGCLATTSYDNSIKIWDVENATSSREVHSVSTSFSDMGSSISNLTFNYDGSLFAVSCRDRAVRICDLRSRLSVVSEVTGRDVFSSFTDSKSLGRNLRVVWCGSPSLNVLLTTSAAMSTGMRQVQLWDPRNLSEPTATRSVDNGSGALFPMFDPDTSVCFIAGRGDTSIRYYDVSAPDDAPSACTLLSQFQGSSSPISGVCLLPKKGCDVRKIETNRILKLAGDTVSSVSFVLPRADDLRQFFQDDVFPDTQIKPTVSCSEWLADATRSTAPVLESLKPDDLDILSTGRASLPRNMAKSRVSSFREEIQRQEEENKQKDVMFDRLQHLAMQRASYHPNPSGGGKPPEGEIGGDDDSSDGGWDD
ncbi:unnamed protein product [Ectocarpus fasciculatus]